MHLFTTEARYSEARYSEAFAILVYHTIIIWGNTVKHILCIKYLLPSNMLRHVDVSEMCLQNKQTNKQVKKVIQLL